MLSDRSWTSASNPAPFTIAQAPVVLSLEMETYRPLSLQHRVSRP